MTQVEFYFDCSSPWTYLAFHNIRPLADEFEFEIIWRPILVGGIFNAVNPSVYESRKTGVPAKQAYMVKDLADWAALARLKILFPPGVFPVNSVKAMRGCIWLAPQGLLVPFAESVFHAYWSEDRDISRDEELALICDRIGIDTAAFFAGIAAPTIKDELRFNTEQVITRGGFGSPTYFLGDDMYFGNDRLPVLIEAIKRQRRKQSPAA